MIDPASAILLFTLFQASEKVIGYAGGKIADSMSKTVWEALEEKARWLAGKDDTAKRWKAYTKAFEEAKTRFETEAPDQEVARSVSATLENLQFDSTADRDWLSHFVPEPGKASLLSEKPDISLVAGLIVAARRRVGESTPTPVDVADAVVIFVRVFQDQLFAQPAYQELMLKQAWWDQLRKPRYDTCERYLEQIIDRHQDLEFVGIPELKDRQALKIEDVFIQLQAELDTRNKTDQEWQKAYGQAMEERETAALTQLNEVRNPMVYGEPIKGRLGVKDALSHSAKIVILGDPGSGKTTLLKYVTIAFAQHRSDKLDLQEERLPIFVRLYDYVAKRAERKDDYSLIDYLYTQAYENLSVRLEPGFFESELERGNCCVCLDGLDELGGAGLRREITADAAAFANRFKRNRFIVTSRLVGYEEAPLDRSEFIHHTILPFTDDDIRAFIQKWYTSREKEPARAKERAEHLTKTVMNEERIKSLATNPLMLTIIALVHRIEAELPHERVKLYDKCVTALVQTWEEVKGLEVEDKQRPYYKHRRRLLEQLAYRMHSHPGQTGRASEMREGDLQLLLKGFLTGNPKLQLDDEDARQEAEEFVKLIKGRTGLLIERGDGIYAFAHLTFQEYLAAADIEHRLAHSIEAIWAEIQPRLHYAHWHEVILLLLGSLNKFEQHNTELVQRIFSETDAYETALHRHVYLAARALADRVEVEVSLHNQIIDSLYSVAHDGGYWLYDDAVAALSSQQDDSRAAQQLLALARQPDTDGREVRDIAQALAQLGHADQATPLLLALARDAQVDAGLRRDAAQALAQLGHADQATLTGLFALAHDAQMDAYVRSTAAQALAQLGHADQATPLLLALARDAQVAAYVRRDAAQALAQFGHADQATPLLLDLARDAQVDAYVRSTAAQALAQLGYADQAILTGLLDVVCDAQMDVYVRRAAAQALAQFDHADQATLTGLLALVRDAQADAYVRRDAAQVLAQLGHADQATLTGLLALVCDAQVDAYVRSAAAQVLAQLGHADHAILNGLVALIQNASEVGQVRYNAYKSLKALLSQ